MDSFLVQAIRASDPDFADLCGTATKVAVYNLQMDNTVNPPKPKWHSLNVDGPMYILRRRTEPYLRLVVKCKKLPNDFVEDVTAQFKLELQRPYLLYQNKQGEVNGIWFEKDDECLAINRLLEDLIRQLQQAAQQPPPQAPPTNGHPDTDGDMSKVLQMLQLGGKQPSSAPAPAPAAPAPAAPPADGAGMARILNMLNRGTAPSAPAPQPATQAPQPAYPQPGFPPQPKPLPLAPQDLAAPGPHPHSHGPPPPMGPPHPMPPPHGPHPHPHGPPPPMGPPMPMPMPAPPVQVQVQVQRVPVVPTRDQLRAALLRVVTKDEFLDLLAGEIAKEIGAHQGQGNASTF